MKSAQTIAEYAIMSLLFIILAVAAVSAFHISDFARGGAFGLRSDGNSLAIPPMTP